MRQQFVKHDQYDRTSQNQSKFSQRQSFYHDSSMNSPQTDIRTPKCLTDRDSYFMSANTVHHLKNIDSGGNLNHTMSSNQFNLNQNNSERKNLQQQQSFKNILTQQRTGQLNGQINNKRGFDQQQDFSNNKNNNAINYKIDQNIGTNHIHQYNNKQANNQKNMQYYNNANYDSNNNTGMNSMESFSQMSGDFSQNGDHSYKHTQPIQQQIIQEHYNRHQKDKGQNQSQGIQKLSFGHYQNDEKMKSHEIQKQLNNRLLNKNIEQPTEYEVLNRLNTISNQIKDLQINNNKFSLDFSKLNKDNSNKIDSSRSNVNQVGVRKQFFGSEIVQSPSQYNITSNKDEKYKKKRNKSNKSHHYYRNNHRSKSRSSSNSSSDDISSCGSSSSSGDERIANKHLNRKSKHQYQHEFIKNEKQNQVIFNEIEQNINGKFDTQHSKSGKKSRKSSKSKNLDKDILHIGKQCIKEVNICSYLKDIFMFNIGSTECFRRLLVEKKYSDALFGMLKVFNDLVGKINFNNRYVSPINGNSRVSHSPMTNLNNTSKMTIYSNIQNRNDGQLTQSRFVPVAQIETPKQFYLQNGSISSRNCTQPSLISDNVNQCLTDRSYHNRSPSPLNTQSFVSTKNIGNYHIPIQYQSSSSLMNNNKQIFNNSLHDSQSYSTQAPNQYQKKFSDSIHEVNSRQMNQLNLSSITNKSNNQTSQHQTGQSINNDKYDNKPFIIQQSNHSQNIRDYKLQKNVLSELNEEQELTEENRDSKQFRDFDDPYFQRESKQPSSQRVTLPINHQNTNRFSNEQQMKNQLEFYQSQQSQHKIENNKQQNINHKISQNQDLYDQNQIRQSKEFHVQNTYQNDHNQNQFHLDYNSPQLNSQNDQNNNLQNSNQQNYNSPQFTPFNHQQTNKSQFCNRIDQNCQSFNPQKQNQQIKNQPTHDTSYENQQRYKQQSQDQYINQGQDTYNQNNQTHIKQNKNQYNSNQMDHNNSLQYLNFNQQESYQSENQPKKKVQSNSEFQQVQQQVQKAGQNNINHQKQYNSRYPQSPSKTKIQYDASSSINNFDSDSVCSPQRKDNNIKTQKKQNKSSRSFNQIAQIAQTKNKAQNKSFDVDDDATSTHSIYGKQQAGATPKQKGERKGKYSIVGAMPCMRRTSKNEGLSPSKQKGSQTNLKFDYSNKGSYSNLDSKTNSVYGNNHPHTHDHVRSASPIAGIENIGSRKRIQPEQRAFDIINGHSLTPRTPKVEFPQIKIIDTEQTPQNINKSLEKTPSLGSDNERSDKK